MRLSNASTNEFTQLSKCAKLKTLISEGGRHIATQYFDVCPVGWLDSMHDRSSIAWNLQKFQRGCFSPTGIL